MKKPPWLAGAGAVSLLLDQVCKLVRKAHVSPPLASLTYGGDDTKITAHGVEPLVFHGKVTVRHFFGAGHLNLLFVGVPRLC